MHKIKLYLSILLVTISVCEITQSQTVDSSAFKLYTRLSFYSFEKNGEFLLHVPSAFSQNNLSVIIKTGSDTIASWTGRSGRIILRIPFLIKLPNSVYNIEALIKVSANPSVIYLTTSKLNILLYKSNEVKTDRLTGALIVNKRQFFAFGFYTYSPVYPTLPEEEVVKGFNVISPYQKILSETLSERKAYMDRCAQIGMKVHYNLLSVSGGGGVGSKIDDISFTRAFTLINKCSGITITSLSEVFYNHPISIVKKSSLRNLLVKKASKFTTLSLSV